MMIPTGLYGNWVWKLSARNNFKKVLHVSDRNDECFENKGFDIQISPEIVT